MTARRIEGDEAAVSPQVLSDLLSLVLNGGSIPAPVIATWTPREREDAAAWAGSEHLAASDNGRRRLPQPPLVTRAVEICSSPVMAQLAAEGWTHLKERMERGEFGCWDDMADSLVKAGQDAVTGLLVLLAGRPREVPWRKAAAAVLGAHPEGLSPADLAALLGSAAPSREELDSWLARGRKTGLLERQGPGTWRLGTAGARP